MSSTDTKPAKTATRFPCHQVHFFRCPRASPQSGATKSLVCRRKILLSFGFRRTLQVGGTLEQLVSGASKLDLLIWAGAEG